MPLSSDDYFGPPTETEIDNISVSRWEDPDLFTWYLLEQRAVRRYGVELGTDEEIIEVFEKMKGDLRETEDRMTQLRQHKAELEKYIDMLKDEYRTALDNVAEKEIERQTTEATYSDEIEEGEG